MSRKGKIQRAMGIVLLVALLVPVVVLSIPQTYTKLVFYEVPGPGMVTMIESEYVEITYIPLVNIARYSAITPIDIVLFIIYGGLFALAVWLVIRSRRHKLKEA